MATPAPKSVPGNMANFNILHGFAEALVRGMRSSFLADADYHHMTQCETLDDVRLNLSETDYGDALADMNTLIPTGLQKVAVEKVRFGFSFCRPRCFRHFFIYLGGGVENWRTIFYRLLATLVLEGEDNSERYLYFLDNNDSNESVHGFG